MTYNKSCLVTEKKKLVAMKQNCSCTHSRRLLWGVWLEKWWHGAGPWMSCPWGEMVARVSAGHAWRRLSLTTFSGGLKIPQETQISPWLTSERSTRCGHEHRNDVGKILSVLVHPVQQPANSTVAFSARQCLQMPNVSVKFCQNG